MNMMLDTSERPTNVSFETLLLDESHKIVLTIPVESCHSNRSRHLLIISAPPKKLSEEFRAGYDEPVAFSRMCSAYGKMTRNSKSTDLDYCLLGVDTFMQGEEEVTCIGFVLKMLWGTETSLDGDGGFGVHILNMHYMFKPVSLQFLWTAIQTLHAISARLKPKRNSICVTQKDWVRSYEEQISSPQSCINEWNEMSDILSHRPYSPDDLNVLSNDAACAETMKTIIKSKLREIMKTVDLDDITSKSIRLRLESELNQNLSEFKAFIDEEILLILGQMDSASKIFDFMYLGSEWNASNLEELNANGITHILNVTREIDNFFPAVFKYMNIREYDVEETDLLKYWDKTYSFVSDCIELGGKVLVHCKMGISRSASTVCAFAMKHFGWSLDQALEHTKQNRSIINPNNGFRHQLCVYEGILKASRQRLSFRKQQRPNLVLTSRRKKDQVHESESNLVNGSGLRNSPSDPCINIISGEKIKEGLSKRPASWSPPAHFLLEKIGTESTGSTTHEPRPRACHCYSQLTAYFASPYTKGCPTLIARNPPKSDQTGNAKRFYSLPGREDMEDATESELEQPVDRGDSCPAQSHLSQCTCNLELELEVSEHPVDIFEQNPETDLILRNIGNLPIHIRQAQHWRSNQHNSSHEEKASDNTPVIEIVAETEADFCNVDFSVIHPDDQNNEITLDTAGAEELSVKTLANMFDFRLGDPSIAKPMHKVRESRINEIPRETNVTNCSEC